MNSQDQDCYSDFCRRLDTCDHVDRLIEVGNWNAAAGAMWLDYGTDEQSIREAAQTFRQFVDELADLLRDVDGYWCTIKQRITDEQWEALTECRQKRDFMHRALALVEQDKLEGALAMFGLREDTEPDQAMRVIRDYGAELREMERTLGDAPRH